LIARHFDGDLLEAVRKTLPLLKGTYGLAVISPQDPDVLVGARLGSPLVLGVGFRLKAGMRGNRRLTPQDSERVEQDMEELVSWQEGLCDGTPNLGAFQVLTQILVISRFLEATTCRFAS
jgi:glucosamine 6-phosphate synthetase-like amidotransferase/phosphosugar isomerase protein